MIGSKNRSRGHGSALSQLTTLQKRWSSMATSSHYAEAMSSPCKRRKTQLACSYCSERKTRCDGIQPSCTPCSRRGHPESCVYQESAIRTQRYVAQLEQRVKELEKSQASSPGRESAAIRSPPDILPAAHADVHLPQTLLNGSDTRAEQQVRPNDDDGTAVDGLATVSPLPLGDEPSAAYGGASTIAFLQNLLIMLDQKSTSRPVSALTSTAKPPPRLSELDPSSLVLPTRRMADNYVDSFFNIVHPLYPIIHRPTFRVGYAALWDPNHTSQSDGGLDLSETPLFWTAVNLVFALGCQFSSLVQPASRPSLAAEFYQRSHKLYTTDLVDTSSIEGVQILLLTAVYLQSTEHASRCWNVLGLAIRAAQALGLHSEQRHQSCDNQLDREIGRRIWYNCVILDKLQSMTFGRPAVLSKSLVRLPKAIDDEYLQICGEGRQPLQQLSQLSFFIHSITLFDILSDILSAMYAAEPERGPVGNGSTPGELHDIIRLSAALDQFAANIPEHLRTSAAPHPSYSPASYMGTADVFRLQANVLNCRFLYTRLILLRPLLLSACIRPTSQPGQVGADSASLDSVFLDHACAVCTTTAISLIDAIHDNMHSVLRNSVWYTVYFTFSSATVLLAARIQITHRTILGDPDASHKPLLTDMTFQSTWGKAIAILDFHRDRIKSAGRAIHVLEVLGDKMEGDRNGPHHDQHDVPAISRQHGLVGRRSPVENYDWTADDFSIGNMSNAWFMQEITNLDFLKLDV